MFKKKEVKKQPKAMPKETVSKVMNDVGNVSTWRDTILPSAFEIQRSTVNLGDVHSRVYSIYNYPSTVGIEWLRPVTLLPNTLVSIVTEPGDKVALIKSINFNIQEARVKYEEASRKSDAAAGGQAEVDYDKTKALLQRIQAENANVLNVTIYIAVYAKTETDLNKLCLDVEGILSGNSFIARTIPYMQEEGFNAFYPIAQNPYKDMTGLIMPADTFYAGLGMFPQNAINDSDGMYLGDDENGNPVFINIWSKTYGKHNMNLCVLGSSGAGKSATCKTMISHELSQGRKVIILDPEEEYIAFAKYFNGNVVDATSERINPLQLRDIPAAFDEMSKEEMEEFVKNKRKEFETAKNFYGNDKVALANATAYQGPLSLHITFLKNWFKLYQPELSDAHLALIENLLYETYDKFNIDEFSDPRDMKNEDFPILSDVYNVLLEHEKSETNEEKAKLYNEIDIYLQSCIFGSDKFMFNGYTTFDLSNKFTVFNIHRLIDSPNNIKNATFYNITSFVWLELTRNRNEQTLLDIDEAHLLINENSQTTFAFLGNLSKRARKYNAGLMLCTQQISDFLHPSVSRYGEGMLGNCATKFLMKSDGSDATRIVNLFDLNSEEEGRIKASDRGQGLLISGDTKTYIQVNIEPSVLALCKLGGGN